MNNEKTVIMAIYNGNVCHIVHANIGHTFAQGLIESFLLVLQRKYTHCKRIVQNVMDFITCIEISLLSLITQNYTFLHSHIPLHGCVTKLSKINIFHIVI